MPLKLLMAKGFGFVQQALGSSFLEENGQSVQRKSQEMPETGCKRWCQFSLSQLVKLSTIFATGTIPAPHAKNQPRRRLDKM